MPNFIQSLFRRQIENAVKNKFNEAFYGTMSGAGTYTKYDTKSPVYLENGYLYNPTVFSVIDQRAKKARQIPHYIKRVKDEAAKKQLDVLKQSTKQNYKPNQLIKKRTLETKAFQEDYLDFPMKKPNELQTWGDIKGLYETFMCITGNFYLYMLKGDFSSEPLAVYVLPAHLMQIVLKPGANLLGTESPISHYLLIEGNKGVRFEVDEVIHIKTPNPEYGMSGEHLYGLSPLRPVLRNIQSSNEGIDNNVRTLLNSGVFGFITGDNIALNDKQALQVTSQLQEMRNSTEALGKIRGASSKLDFTKISVDTDKMQPFAYLMFDEKQICNVLGWDNKLLNNDTAAKFDNYEKAEQRVVVSTTMPSLQLFQEKMQDDFLPLFKGYQDTVFEFDYSELPEMQQDMSEMMVWLEKGVAVGALNRDEMRSALNYPKLETVEMETYTVSQDIIPLTEAIANDFGNDPQTI